MNPEFIDDGKGGKMLAFKDENGAIMRNPNNQLNPYTPGDLLTRELETMGILDKGRQAAGGGTKPPAGGGVMLPLIYPAQKRGLRHTTQSQALCNNKVCRLERLNLTPE